MLGEMDKFLKRQKSPKFTQCYINNLDIPIAKAGVKFCNLKPPHKDLQAHMSSLGISAKHRKNK
jgi:hypothetical protein